MRTLNLSTGLQTTTLICAVFAAQVALAQASATAQVNPATASDPSTAPVQKVDNSAVNQRDRQVGEVTAEQQSSGTADMEITRQIRRALIADKGLSMYAHNIKIITIAGVVTLKGPVKSAREQSKAISFAKSVAGVSKVDNQISIKR